MGSENNKIENHFNLYYILSESEANVEIPENAYKKLLTGFKNALKEEQCGKKCSCENCQGGAKRR